MIKRIGSVFVVLEIALLGACGGDGETPAAVGREESDGGASQNEAGPPATIPPGIEVRAEAATLIRGQDARVRILIIRRNTSSMLTIRVQNTPPGVTSGGDIAVTGDIATAELLLTSSDAAPYGDFTLQIVVSGDDVPEVIAPLALQVRGRPGSLDTSFGNVGSAARVPLGKVGDVIVDSQGRLVLGGVYGNEIVEDDMLMARLTPDGQLDSSFGVGGTLRWASPYGHYARPEVRPGDYRRGLFETPAGYSLLTFLEVGSSGVVVRSHVPGDGTAPSITPATQPADVGSVNLGFAVVPDEEGFFRFELGCKIGRYQGTGQRDATWGVGGVAEVVPATPGCSFEDRMDTQGALHVVTRTAPNMASKLAIVDRATGTLRTPSPALSPQGGLSRPSATGHVLVVDGALWEVDQAGVGVRRGPLMGGQASRGGLGFYWPDGKLGVVLFNDPPVVLTYSPAGDLLVARDGIALEEPEFGRFGKIVDVYPDGAGRLVLVYAASQDEDESERGTIKRFWL